MFLKARIGIWISCFAFSRSFSYKPNRKRAFRSPFPKVAYGDPLFSANTTSLGTASETKSCPKRGIHLSLTRSALLFPDVNECELLSGVCGEAFCENVEGSFLCVCADENQEYSPMTGQCRSRASEGKSQWHCVGDRGLLSGICTHTGLGQTLGVR